MNQVYLSDIPRLFTAIAEWCACLAFLRKQPLRFSGPRLWGTLGLGLAVQCLFLCLTDELYIALWLPRMIGAVGLMFALIAACCNIPLTSVGYFTACAFLTAEFAASLEWQLWSYTRHTLNLPQGAGSTIALSLIFLTVVYAGVFGVMRRLTGRREDPPAAFVFRAEELWPPVVISIACFLMSNLSFVYSNTPFSSSAIEKVGEEGLVLVKNEGLLPLSGDVKALNVFGWGSTNPIFGGTGSGSSDGSSAVGILQSLKDAGYETNAELTKLYTDYRADRPVIDMHSQDWTLPEPTVDAYTDTVMSQAKSFSDTAVIVISRSGGENADLPMDMNAVIHGTYNIENEVSFVPDNYAMELGWIATSDCDGPAGLSNFVTGAYGTAYPSEVLMAQTWNKELIYEMGEAMGQGYAEANKFTDQSATATLAMRQSCKNILYTIGNSGYYANGDPTGGMDNMTKTFLMADIGIGVVLVAAEALLLLSFRKRSKVAQ